MLELRGDIYFYDLLCRIFSAEPSLDLLREIAAINLPYDENDTASNGLLQMIETARFHGNNLEVWQEALSVEFVRLFLGPIEPVSIPYASWYLSTSRQLMTDETLDVRRRYLDAGIAVKELYSIPDDHICIELEFLSYLTKEIISAREGGQLERARESEVARDEFVKEHMQRWVPAFVAAIVNSDADEFYRGAAMLLGEVFMNSEETHMM